MLNPGIVLQNRYQIIQRIGGGGMGQVYLATDLRLGNVHVVVKENLGGDPQLFQAEANILAALRHPNLPRVIDHWQEQPPPLSTGAQYLVMDYIAGQNLADIVQVRGALPELQALAWLTQIIDAVKYLHMNHIIHRDIKPQNIIVMPDGRAMLVDFGIAKVMTPGQATKTAARGFGSPGFAPLEQYSGGTDERSDIYALGATLFFALTGTKPPSATERANGTALPAIRQFNPSVSAGVDSTIQKAMALRNSQRLQDVALLEQGLHPAPAATAMPAWLVWGASIAIITAVILSLIIIVMLAGRTTPVAMVVPTSMTTSVPIITPTAVPSAPVRTTAPPTFVPTTLMPITGQTRIAPGDGAPMIYVPAGEFTMGNNAGFDDEKPEHIVYLDTFWIDKFETTNMLYKKCVDAGKCQPPSFSKSYTRDPYYGNTPYNNFPVIYVSWNDANAYCTWAGKRLPTEAEWEKAARGTDKRTFPWGNTFDKNRLNSYEGGRGDTTVVGNFSSGASPYGAMDMAGNVWEWVADWYDSAYYTNSPRNNPKGPASGKTRIVRGGAWYYSESVAQTADRRYFAPGLRDFIVGFRCAQ